MKNKIVVEEITQPSGAKILYEHFPVLSPDTRFRLTHSKINWIRESTIAFLCDGLFRKYFDLVTFGFCGGGAVFEFRSLMQPTLRFVDREIMVDLGENLGHFHLVLAPPIKNDKRTTERFVARAALFIGVQCLSTEVPDVFGIRMWNDLDEQVLTAFFSDEMVWRLFRYDLFCRLKEVEFLRADIPRALAAEWSNDTPQARLLLYARILYSSHFEMRSRVIDESLPPATAAILNSLPNNLQVERAARHRNLIFALRRVAPLSIFFLDKMQLDELIALWCDSDLFWTPAARSLLESFCLFAYCRVKKINCIQAEIMRIVGVASGLSSQPKQSTPWNKMWGIVNQEEHSLTIVNDMLVESFNSQLRLIDEAGNLILETETVETGKIYKVEVIARPSEVRLRTYEIHE